MIKMCSQIKMKYILPMKNTFYINYSINISNNINNAQKYLLIQKNICYLIINSKKQFLNIMMKFQKYTKI